MNTYTIALRKVLPEDAAVVVVNGTAIDLSKDLVLTVLDGQKKVAQFMPPAWMYYTINPPS